MFYLLMFTVQYYTLKHPKILPSSCVSMIAAALVCTACNIITPPLLFWNVELVEMLVLSFFRLVVLDD